MNATVRYNHGLAGMLPVRGVGANPIHGRHYVFDAGGFLVGLFEHPDHPGHGLPWPVAL